MPTRDGTIDAASGARRQGRPGPAPRIVEPMFVRDLTVELSDLAALPPGYAARAFHDSTHAVVERYLDRLPRRKVRLGDAAKWIVMIGPRPAAGIGVEHDVHVYPGGVGFVWLHDLGLDPDLAAYARADRAAQQRTLLAALDAGLRAAAARTGADAEPIAAATRALAAEPFPLPEIPESELRRRWGLLAKPSKARRPRRAR